jgi:prephenate dehydratase
MQSYPEPAARLVNHMADAAAANPARAIAFQGAPGAYSHLATREVDPDALPLPCFSFEDAFDAVQQGRAARAVIPIENSQAGRVADIHFLLPASRLSIIGEHFLRVRHCLIGLPGAQRKGLRQALSHVQALSQCRARLRDWGIAPVPYADTAGAAAWLAEHREDAVAAIASSLAADVYGLEVLEAGIEDVGHNTTRFVVLRKEAAPLAYDSAQRVMTSFIFEVRNIPAALFKALGGFATNGVNMTKLESYQRGGSFNATEFYADIEGHPEDAAVQRALEELAFHTKWHRILGTYARSALRDEGAA